MAKQRQYALLAIFVSICVGYLANKAHFVWGDGWVVPRVKADLDLAGKPVGSYKFVVTHSFDANSYFDQPLFNAPRWYKHYSKEADFIRQNYSPNQLWACQYYTKPRTENLPELDGSPHGIYVFDPASKEVLLHAHFR